MADGLKTLPAAAVGGRGKNPSIVLATCILTSSLAFIDGSVVNVALSSIGHGLGASAGALQWVIDGYLLPLAALLLLGGAAGDRFGSRTLLMVGTFAFGASSLLCACAPSPAWLIGARFVQGSAAAMMMPNSLATLSQTYTGEARGRAIGLWASFGAIGSACGPVLGGVLVDAVGWRSIFLINVPIALTASLFAWRFVPRSPESTGRVLDWRGGVLATLALGSLSLGLTRGAGDGGWTRSAIALVAAGIALFCLFTAWQRRRGDAAMLPLHMFASSNFVGLTVLTLLLYGALGALFVQLPFVLIHACGESSLMAGASLLPVPITLALASPRAGKLAARIGSRLPLTIGPAIAAIGFLLMMRITPDGHYATRVFPALLVVACGLTGAVAPLTSAVLSSVDARYTGSASGLNSAVARTGGLISTALIGSVLAARGEKLLHGFHAYAAIAACACLGASLSALLLVRRGPPVQPGTAT